MSTAILSLFIGLWTAHEATAVPVPFQTPDTVIVEVVSTLPVNGAFAIVVFDGQVPKLLISERSLSAETLASAISAMRMTRDAVAAGTGAAARVPVRVIRFDRFSHAIARTNIERVVRNGTGAAVPISLGKRPGPKSR